MMLFRPQFLGRRIVPRISKRLLSSKQLIDIDLSHPDCNVTESIASKIGRNLHLVDHHPLHILHHQIREYFHDFECFDNLSPICTTNQSFDLLRIPPDHVSRSPSDTYYLNPETVLRPHTSAHQIDLLQQGHSQFLVTGDVYRRDEIDRSHYPVFHQTEGVKLLSSTNTAEIRDDLQHTLEGLVRHLFGDVQMRWNTDYFPFTDPSLELEIYYQDTAWLEVLGCGVIHPEVLANAQRPEAAGWAFGLGLERLAMILFGVPDIRLFWSTDPRFADQFRNYEVTPFQAFSKYPACFKDMSFWLTDKFHVNDLNEVVRDVAGDWVESLQLVDAFTHPRTQRTSHCYRIAYRSMERSLTNLEVDALQERVREDTVRRLGVELR